MADGDEIDVAALIEEYGEEGAERQLLTLGYDPRSASEAIALEVGEDEGHDI